MRHFYLLFAALFMSGLGFGQTTIAVQDFDGTAPQWNFTANPPTYGTGSDDWEILTTNSDPSGTTGSFWGMQDLENPNGGGAFEHTLTFESIDISTITNVQILFDYYTVGFDSTDEIRYEIFYGEPGSEIGQGIVFLDKDTNAWTTISVNIPDTANSAYIVLGAVQNGGSDYAGFDNVEITGTLATSDTTVEFVGSSSSVSESAGSTDLTFNITNPDATNATSFDVVLLTGEAADIDGYTTQTVTFPANSSTDETLTLTITDDMVFEGDETLTFEIQNVSGGNNASVGFQTTFDLTIEDNDPDPSVVIAIEDFDNPDAKWNNNIADQLFVDPDSSDEGLFIQPASSNNPNFSGNTAFARDLVGESGEPSLDPYTFTFESVIVSGFTNLQVSFDYHAFANAEVGSYEVFIDGIGQGTVEYFNDPDSAPGVNGTVIIPIPDGTFLVGLQLTGGLNGGSDVVEFDNFQITGIYSGLAYSNGSWTPNAPDGTTGSSNAIVLDGTATLSADADLQSVTVNPGANLEVPTGITLTALTLDLESNSERFASLIVDGTLAGNIVNNVTYRRWVNETNFGLSGGNDLITSPLTGLTFGDFIEDFENSSGGFPIDPELHIIYNDYDSFSDPSQTYIEFAFGPFDNDSQVDYFNYFYDTEFPGDSDDYFQEIFPQKGYRVATVFSSPVVFRGGVNTGSVSTSDFNANGLDPLDKWNLVGNPYPSYLDAQELLSVNSGVIDASFNAIYGYNDSTDESATGIWTIINNLQNTDINIAPGQGFFVPSNGTGQLSFTPAMRTTSGTDDFIQGRNGNTSATHHLTLNLSKADASFNTDIYFTNEATQGLNPGYDAGLYGGTASAFSIFSHLVEENQGIPFGIQALGETDYNNVVIPLGVNAPQGELLTFTISYSDLPSDIDVYLEDNVTNTFTLLNTSDYTLTPNADLNGTGRFFLRFGNSVLSTPENAVNGINIYTPQHTQTVVIAGNLNTTTTAEIYDIQGRLVISKLLTTTSSEQAIDISSISSGIYVIKLYNDTLEKTQKFIKK